MSPGNDSKSMPDQVVNKYVIRESMKGLQAQRSFATLEELSEAVVQDLQAEGFAVGAEERLKIQALINEEGYTGRFAIDDVLRRKLGGKRWLPVASLVVGALIFLATTTVAALIEHYVQKPLEDDHPAAPLTAVFQVPERAGDQLEFQLQLTNISGTEIRNLVVFASAGEITKQFALGELGVAQSQSFRGSLDLRSLPQTPEVEFVAYVIAGDFSLRSQPTRVARAAQAVAMAPRARSRSKRTQNFAASQMKAPAMESSAAPAGGDVAVAYREINCEPVDSAGEMERLRNNSDPASQRLLEAYGSSTK